MAVAMGILIKGWWWLTEEWKGFLSDATYRRVQGADAARFFGLKLPDSGMGVRGMCLNREQDQNRKIFSTHQTINHGRRALEHATLRSDSPGRSGSRVAGGVAGSMV
jgi:hypothetical protein